MIVINRRRFLRDSVVATAGLSLVPAAVAASEALAQGAPVSFDLHAHPGAFFDKGRPEYAGDAAFVKTVTDMRDVKLSGAFFSLVADYPLIERTPTGIVPRGVYAAGGGAREYRRQLNILRELLTRAPAFLATRSSDLFRAHYVPSLLGDLQTQPRQHGGLSSLGKAVVKRATAAGMVVDVAHAAFDTVRDVASQTSAPLILSHSILKIDDNRPLAARAISEEHAKLVAKTGGVIGAWPSGFNASFDEFVSNTKRLIDVVGIDHVGLGTDMDGNFRPVLSAYAQVTDLADGLQAKGFTRAEVAKVLGGNMQRVLTHVVG